ncbi:hypothetical protein [Microlunatus speluncae]|uniref:hypothetical protein n=1 Tax=Microlunatus speluncae TaxID=2594267 RepID=UPI001266714E|nr:hypothetical protein [Microlunatus speluncae]
MIAVDRPLPPRLGPSVRLLRWMPVLWLALLINDTAAVGLVAMFGESMAFPGMSLLDTPNDLPMVPISFGPLAFAIVGAAVLTLADRLIVRRLSTSAGPAFLVLGLTTTANLLFLAGTAWANPLWVITFGGGDAGMPEIAPGPLGYQYVRAMLLVLIVAARIAVVVLAGGPSATAEVRSRSAPITTRPRPALLAAIGLVTLTGAGLVILTVNGVAFGDLVGRAGAMRPEPYSLRQFLNQALFRLLTLAGLLIAGVVVSALLARTFHRGGRSTFGAIATGLVAGAWPIVLYVCLLINPAGWKAPLRLVGQRLEAAWYPVIITPIMIIAAGSLLLLWVSLALPGTVRWLINGRAAADRST